MQYRWLVATLALALIWPAWARDHHDGAIEVSIIADRGGQLREYPVERRGDLYRAYVEARAGDEYGIRVRNRTGHRIGVVVAVDGRNIISGRRSNLQPDERMYILNPYQENVFRGWRTDRDRVNRFYFTDAGNSYAAAWGDHSAMGVIAVAAYRERQVYRHDERAQQQRKFGTQSEPGTGFGRDEWSPSRRVEFEPERHPFSRVFFKYEWRESLCRRGVIDCRGYDRDHRPNRLWDDGGFAPPPPLRYRSPHDLPGGGK